MAFEGHLADEGLDEHPGLGLACGRLGDGDGGGLVQAEFLVGGFAESGEKIRRLRVGLLNVSHAGLPAELQLHRGILGGTREGKAEK
ncbi:MAG: hypothetical protein B7Z37_30230 [Verrucomicrobia bacterium 12-59-8]|nr:MAG: hypothetical protein B7Z37_30230 [Verrucomicrobia bacterium 12-59-8]